MGYRTGYVGKYLNSYGSETDKTHIPSGWDDWQATTVPSAYRMYNYTVNDNGQLMQDLKREIIQMKSQLRAQVAVGSAIR